jgi:glycosyltransferase involved in cell wall biosynthesis
MTSLIIDCTELYQNPIRTGIQRAVRELLSHWPYDRVKARIARFDPLRGLVPLSERAIRILTDEEPGVATMSYEALVGSLRSADAKPDPLPSDYLVFIPELFYDHARCSFYQARAPAMLSYDFLPWLRPELFSSRIVGLMPYLRLISKVPHVAFISHSTRLAYETRITRRPASGPVLPLGADGLRVEHQAWRPGRKGYVSIGALVAHKNQHLIIAAFISLWQQGHDIPLTMIGHAFEAHRLGWLSEAREFPQFRWLRDVSDRDLGEALRAARATIYVSETEGFGLPPIESLAVGVPVIAAASCPSVAMLHPPGVLVLSEVTVKQIGAAVLSLEEDQRLADLWGDAATAQLGTWRDFALATAEWLQNCDPAVSVPRSTRDEVEKPMKFAEMFSWWDRLRWTIR